MFNKSDAVGKAGEAIAAGVLERCGCIVSNVGSEKQRKDLECSLNGNTFTVEVKNDLESLRTGNFFFELKSVAETTADFMCFIQGTECHFFRTIDAKKVLTLSGYKTLNVNQSKVGSRVPYNGKVVPVAFCHSVDAIGMIVMWVDDSILERGA